LRSKQVDADARLAGVVLNEEQHIQAAKQHDIDVEEVRRQDRLGPGLQERAPGLADAPGRGLDAPRL
jgi:hypothetical protein